MKYKICVDYMKGYSSLGIHNAKRTIMIIDSLMLDKNFKTIIVVGIDKENNEDIPMFFFNGFNYDEYGEFRNNLIEENDIKKYSKRI